MLSEINFSLLWYYIPFFLLFIMVTICVSLLCFLPSSHFSLFLLFSLSTFARYLSILISWIYQAILLALRICFLILNVCPSSFHWILLTALQGGEFICTLQIRKMEVNPTVSGKYQPAQPVSSPSLFSWLLTHNSNNSTTYVFAVFSNLRYLCLISLWNVELIMLTFLIYVFLLF